MMGPVSTSTLGRRRRTASALGIRIRGECSAARVHISICRHLPCIIAYIRAAQRRPVRRVILHMHMPKTAAPRTAPRSTTALGRANGT